MSTSNRKDVATLNLVQCEDYWFPVARQDLLLLRTNSITSARIPARALPMFKHAFLSDVRVQEHSWEDVLSSLLTHFENSLSKVLPSAVLKHKEDELLVALPWDKDDSADSVAEEMTKRVKKTAIASAAYTSPNQEREEQLAKYFKQLQRYLGQYSWSVSVNRQDQTKKLGAMIYKISKRFNPDLNNAIFFESIPDAPTIQTLELGTSFRLKFALETLADREVLAVYTEDYLGGIWQSRLQRTFQRKQLDKDNIASMVDFFIAHFL